MLGPALSSKCALAFCSSPQVPEFRFISFLVNLSAIDSEWAPPAPLFSKMKWFVLLCVLSLIEAGLLGGIVPRDEPSRTDPEVSSNSPSQSTGLLAGIAGIPDNSVSDDQDNRPPQSTGLLSGIAGIPVDNDSKSRGSSSVGDAQRTLRDSIQDEEQTAQGSGEQVCCPVSKAHRHLV